MTLPALSPTWRRWKVAPPSVRSIRLAVVVGFGLRLAWAIAATRTPSQPLSDLAQYLRLARDFADGHPMTLGGYRTAWFSPGYPLMLVPIVWLSRLGIFSLEFGASLLNVVAGSATVVLTARLASVWFGDRVAAVSAWILAVGVGQILFVAAPLSETMATFFVMWILCEMSAGQPSGEPGGVERPSVRNWNAHWRDVKIGVLVLVLLLTRAQFLGLILLPLLISWQRTGSARRGRRRFATISAIVAVGLAGSAVANHSAIGLYTPNFTGVGSFMCMGHRDGATGLVIDDPDVLVACFRGSPFDNRALYDSNTDFMTESPGQMSPQDVSDRPPDEARWFHRVSREAVDWAVSHPTDEIRMSMNKTIELFVRDDDSLTAATDFGQQRLPNHDVELVLAAAANLWFWAVVLLAAIALGSSKLARSGWPLVVVIGWLTVAVWGGIALPRYHHAMVPILSVLAAVALVAWVRQYWSRGADQVPGNLHASEAVVIGRGGSSL